MQTINLINMMYTNTKSLKPEIGMGATELCWSDRHAYTVIEISNSGKKLKLQRDKAIRTDNNGMCDSQSYRYEQDPKGYTVEVSLRKDGRWKEVRGTTVYLVGDRDEYYDYSF